MVGWQKTEDVYRYFWAGDLAIFPGTHSVLWEEAIGHGLGTVLFRWKGMEHHDVGGNVLFIDDAEPATLDDTLMRIGSDADLVNSLNTVAREIGVQRLSYSKIAESALA